MRPTADHIDRFLLQTLCKELLPFERVVAEAERSLISEEVELVPERMLALLKKRLINGYLLHAEPPFVTPVDTDANGLRRHWFFISREGLHLLMNLQAQAEQENPLPGSEHHMRQRSVRRNRQNLGC